MAWPKGKPRPAGAGRQKGSQNKFSISVKDAVLETFQKLGGVKHMLGWANENQTEFYKIAAKLIPSDVQASVNHSGNVNVNWPIPKTKLDQ